jgi:glycosyltransferase involved in cell wall biosynthesis
MPRGEASKVSVIITCYNGERWIVDAVNSALAQTYRPLEIIVVDDGSTDGSRDILRRYEGHDEIKLRFHPRNLGIPATKNAGVAQSSGRYVALLEQDDAWYENKLARQVAVMESDPAYGMVFTDTVVVGPGGKEYIRRHRVEIPDSAEELVRSFFLSSPVISMSSVMFRRAALSELGGFDERYVGGDDYALFLRLTGRHKVAFIDEPLLRYRWHQGSFSWRRADRMIEDHARILREAVAWYPHLRPVAGRRTAQLWLSAALRAYENRETARALRCAITALRTDPWFPKTVPALGLMATGSLGRRLLASRRWTLQFQPYQKG